MSFPFVGDFHNNWRMLLAAGRFHQMTFKLLQIRAAEEWARIFAPTRLYRAPCLPRDIVIRVTEKCFLKCKFCAQGGEKGRVDRRNPGSGPVESETLLKIMEETSRWPIKPFIKITGGEPLVQGEDLLGPLAKMRERGFIVKLNTNGMLLKSKLIARRIAEADINYLSVSLDAGPDVHNEIRGNPKLFDAMMEGLDNVRYYRRKLGSRNLMILISMMVSSETQDQIEKVFRVAEEKADWLNIQFLNYTTTETCREADEAMQSRLGASETPWHAFCNPRFNKIDPDAVATQIQRIMAIRSPLPVSVMGRLNTRDEIDRYYFSKDPIRQCICLIPFTGMHIVPPGKAMFCIDYPFYDYGDVRTDSVRSIWYGARAARFRNDLVRYYKEHKKCYPQCQRCNWRFN